MNSRSRNGLILAVVQVALVGSLGGKLLADRARYPRVWARAAPVDPTLPIRGRYVRLRLEATPTSDLTLPPPRPVTLRDGTTRTAPALPQPVRLFIENGQLMAAPGRVALAPSSHARAIERDGSQSTEVEEPVAFFIPEGLPDPSRLEPGEELWVEVTLPRAGAPRPIRLGVKKDGVLRPV